MDEHFMTVLRTEKTFGQKYAQLLSTKDERVRQAQDAAREESLKLFKQAQDYVDVKGEEHTKAVNEELLKIQNTLEHDLSTLDGLDLDKIVMKIMKKVAP